VGGGRGWGWGWGGGDAAGAVVTEPADEGAGAAAHTPLPIPRAGPRIGRRGRRGTERARLAQRKQVAAARGEGGGAGAVVGLRACRQVGGWGWPERGQGGVWMEWLGHTSETASFFLNSILLSF
jgi:hypothetical protein